MSTILHDWLSKNSESPDFCDPLAALGVIHPSDILLLDEDDLDESVKNQTLSAVEGKNLAVVLQRLKKQATKEASDDAKSEVALAARLTLI